MLPFPENNHIDLKQKSFSKKYILKFKLSPEFGDKIGNMLTVNTGQRPTVHDIVSFA